MYPLVVETSINIDHLPAELFPVLAYWESQTPDGAVGPGWSEFDLLNIPGQLLPYSAVVDYDDETATFRYRFWGSRLTDVFRNDFTGKTFEELPDRFRDAAIQTYTDVVESKKPRLVQFSIDEATGVLNIQQAFRLPLSNDGNNVANIFTVLMYPWNWRDLKSEAEKHIWSDPGNERHSPDLS